MEPTFLSTPPVEVNEDLILSAKELRLVRKELAAIRDLIEILFERLGQGVPETTPDRLQEYNLPSAAKVLLTGLPQEFTVEEVIAASEKMGLDVFTAYGFIQQMVDLKLLSHSGNRFSKT